jgi:hypothetical protein
VIALFRR